MNNESIAKLRVDRRLHRRRDWIGREELERELDALPDVADKIRPPGEDEVSAGDWVKRAAMVGFFPRHDQVAVPKSEVREIKPLAEC